MSWSVGRAAACLPLDSSLSGVWSFCLGLSPELWEQGVKWMFAGCELLTFSHQTQVSEFLEEHPTSPIHLAPLPAKCNRYITVVLRPNYGWLSSWSNLLSLPQTWREGTMMGQGHFQG